VYRRAQAPYAHENHEGRFKNIPYGRRPGATMINPTIDDDHMSFEEMQHEVGNTRSG